MTGPVLAERIRTGEKLVGGLLRLPNPYLTELFGLHRRTSRFSIASTVRARSRCCISTSSLLVLETLVRLAGGEPDAILRVLDTGAAGLIVPRVSTAEQARAVVESASYPPKGSRGFAAYTPAARHGLAPAQRHLDDPARLQVIVAMIEDEVAVHNAHAIAAVEGITGLLMGPADLAVSFGLPGETAQRILQSTRYIHAAAHQAGRAAVVIVGGPQAASAAFAPGRDWSSITSRRR